MRRPGPLRMADIDTLALIHDLTMKYQDELHRPRWPYKFKIKASGCPNDCVAAIARADFTIIGTWRDSLRIDQKEVSAYVASGFDIASLVVRKCPSEALEYDGTLRLIPEDCVRCMHCINMMPKAIRPGLQKGATILIGGKAPILKGASLSWVLVPFMEIKPPYTEVKDLLRRYGTGGTSTERRERGWPSSSKGSG